MSHEQTVRDALRSWCNYSEPAPGSRGYEAFAALDALVSERDEARARLSSVGGYEGYDDAWHRLEAERDVAVRRADQAEADHAVTMQKHHRDLIALRESEARAEQLETALRRCKNIAENIADPYNHQPLREKWGREIVGITDEALASGGSEAEA